MSRGKRWTEAEHRKLIHMRNVERLPWPKIMLPGRNPKCCKNEYFHRRFGDLLPAGASFPRALHAPRVRRAAPRPEPRTQIVVGGAVPAKPRQMNLEAVRHRAELRDRILERGITGGLCGDPPPGRSALDQRIAERG